MQISNNTNLNFTGAFRIKPQETIAKEEIPKMFTQGRQIFHNILENGDEVIVLRNKYDKRVGQYIKENNTSGIEYYPNINTCSGLDNEKPEGLIELIKDKAVVVKTELEDILASIAVQPSVKKAKKYKVANEVEKISNALRLNIENPKIESNKNFTRIRDNGKGRTIEVVATNPAISYVYVKPDSLNEDSIKCIINAKGQVAKIFSTPNDISKFMKIFRELKNSGSNILV